MSTADPFTVTVTGACYNPPTGAVTSWTHFYVSITTAGDILYPKLCISAVACRSHNGHHHLRQFAAVPI